jgi:hypothetical protein
MGQFLYTDNAPPEETESSADQAYATIPPTTGERLGAEAGATTGQLTHFLGREFTPTAESTAHLRGPMAQQAQQAAQASMIDPDEANKRYAPTDQDGKQMPLFDKPVPDSVAQSIGRAKANEIEREGILSRYGNAHSTLTGFGVGAVGFMLDPIQAGSMLLPGIGEEAIMAKLGTDAISTAVARGTAGAVTGGGAMVPVAALKYGIGQTEASDYDLRSAFSDVAGGAMFGAVMHAAVMPGLKYAWTEGRLRLAEQGILPPSAESIPVTPDDLRSAVQAGQDRSWLQHLNSVYGAEDVLNADATTTRAALQSALSQVIDGRPVDISPIFPDHGEAARRIDPQAFEEFDALAAEQRNHAGLLVPRERAGGPEDVTAEAGRVLPGAVGLEMPEGLTPEEQAQYAIKGYHGSPHEFDRLDASKRFTGIGHQTYGSGISVSSERSIGEAFSNLSGKGFLYDVSMDTSPERMLDFDKRLNDQSQHVKDAIARIDPSISKRLSGDMIYDELMHGSNRRTNDEASKALQDSGIDGIQYTVGGAKGTQYTIFDSDKVKITHKNGEPVTAKERADAIEQMQGGEKGEKFALPGGDRRPNIDLDIAKAYREIRAANPNDKWVYLSDLRAKLQGHSREEVDAALKRLWLEGADQERRAVDLSIQDDQGRLTEANRAGATNFGGTRQDLISIEHGSPILEAPTPVRKRGKSDTSEQGSEDDSDPTFSRDKAGQPVASFKSSDLLIKIAMDADNKLGLLSHEAVHALRHLDVFTPEEWGTLEKTARDQGWIESQNVRDRYAEAYKGRPNLESLLTEEAIAEQYSQWRTGAKQYAPEIQTLFQKIKDFFARVAEWMKGNGFQSADEASLARLHAAHPEQPIFSRIASGEMKERFEAPIRARKAEVESRMAALEPRIRDAYARAKASARPDMPAIAESQRSLYRDGYAQGMPQDELKQIMEELYAPPRVEAAEAAGTTAASGQAGTIGDLKTEAQKLGDSLADAENPATARSEEDRAAQDEASAKIPPELAAEEARMQQMMAEGYKLDPEEAAELSDSQAALQAADLKQQAYAQAAECLIEAGI